MSPIGTFLLNALTLKINKVQVFYLRCNMKQMRTNVLLCKVYFLEGGGGGGGWSMGILYPANVSKFGGSWFE